MNKEAEHMAGYAQQFYLSGYEDGYSRGYRDALQAILDLINGMSCKQQTTKNVCEKLLKGETK